MNSPTIVPLNDMDGMRAAGVRYPESIHGWRWLFRCRYERGIADAFIRSGRRVLVNVPRYIELTQQQVATASPKPIASASVLPSPVRISEASRKPALKRARQRSGS